MGQVGSSRYRIDMVALHPHQEGRFALAIECDGASYYSAPTARDRDRLRQQQLEAWAGAFLASGLMTGSRGGKKKCSARCARSNQRRQRQTCRSPWMCRRPRACRDGSDQPCASSRASDHAQCASACAGRARQNCGLHAGRTVRVRAVGTIRRASALQSGDRGGSDARARLRAAPREDRVGGEGGGALSSGETIQKPCGVLRHLYSSSSSRTSLRRPPPFLNASCTSCSRT